MPAIRLVISAGLASFTAGIIASLVGVAANSEITWRLVALGTAEAFGALFIAFANLALAWLLVALGLRRAA